MKLDFALKFEFIFNLKKKKLLMWVDTLTAKKQKEFSLFFF